MNLNSFTNGVYQQAMGIPSQTTSKAEAYLNQFLSGFLWVGGAIVVCELFYKACQWSVIVK